MNEEQKRAKIIVAIGTILFIAVIVVGFLASEGFFHSNQYGNQIKIDNFSSYYPDVPVERRDSIFATLFRAVTDNVDNIEEIPKSGAMVRKGAKEPTYNSTTGITHIDFFVDIAAIRQSYQVQYEWADSEANQANLSGYQGLVTCIRDPQYIIYQDFKCQDMFSDDPYSDLTKKYPIIKELPIIVEYYSNNYADYTRYTITYNDENPDDVYLIVTDYSGDSYDKALSKIRELGYNPDDYKIVLDDSYVFQIPASSEILN